MARHSHWAQIKLKKGALDKKRGKIFTRHARLIEMATRRAGGDPAMNASLRLAMENARADNMPRENIDRAIKKALGAAAGAEQVQQRPARRRAGARRAGNHHVERLPDGDGAADRPRQR